MKTKLSVLAVLMALVLAAPAGASFQDPGGGGYWWSGWLYGHDGWYRCKLQYYGPGYPTGNRYCESQ